MMKFNLDQPIYDLDGKPIEKNRNKEPMTAGYAARTALVHPPANPISADESLRRYDLQSQFIAGGAVQISPEEYVILKNCIANVYSPLILGQVIAAIDK